MFRGLWAGGAQTPGYGLGPADVQRIQKQMVGLPITIEHEGLVHSAPKVLGAADPSKAFADELAKMDGARRAVGRVTAVGTNDDVYFELEPQYDPVRMLLNRGLLRGLSLTHADVNGAKVPLELTLTNVRCFVPQLPGAVLTAAAQDPVRTAAFVSKEYIPQDLCPPKTMADAMETSAAPELSPLEKALAGMDAETRTIFEARFGELMGKIQTLETNGLEVQSELTKQLEAAKAEVESAKESQSAAKTNNAILAMQVEQLLQGHLPDESALGKMEQSTISSLIQDEATAPEAFKQVVMACSRRVHQRMAELQQRRPAPLAAAAAAPAAPVEVEEPASKRGRAETTQEFDLSRALRAQFH